MDISIPANYQLVTPDEFTVDQKAFVDRFKESVSDISAQTAMIFGAKDVNSRHFISTDAYAKLVALAKGEEVTDRFDRDMPCEGTAEFAEYFVREDQELLRQGDINKKISVLNIHKYSDGLRAFVFDKHIMKHHPSKSILGTIYSAREIEIANFFTLIPNYVLEFGVGCSIESAHGNLSIENIKLSEYEHEVCFLLIMNWDFKQIAEFFNKHRPQRYERGVDTIYKCRNRICDKLGIQNSNALRLRETLIGMGIHRKMPKSFFQRLLGSNLID